MAAASDIGANAGSYNPNPALGGLTAGVIKIDTAPIQQFNQYAFSYNRTVWEQKQKEADNLVAELSKASSLDLNSLIPDEKKQVLDKYQELTDFGADLAQKQKSGSLDSVQVRLMWQDKLKKTTDFVNVANTRYHSKEQREKQIADETDPELKAYFKKKLDEDIHSTTVEQPIPALQSYDLKKATIPAPKSFQFDVPIYGDDMNFIRNDTVTVADQKDINAQAAQIALGLNKNALDVTSTEYLSKSPEEQKILKDQDEAFRASGKLAEVASSKHYNTIINSPDYKDKDGKLDVAKIRSKNSILAGVMDAMDSYNAHMVDMQQRIRAGEFKDSNGISHLDEKDYQPISYLDGDISAEDLLKPQLLAKAAAEKRDSKVTQSDNKLQADKMKQELEIARMKEAGENSRSANRNAMDLKIAKLKEAGDNARAAAKTANGATTSESEFGNILYSVNSPDNQVLKSKDGTIQKGTSIKGGTIVGKDGTPINFTGDISIPVSYLDNSILTEYNKYVGAKTLPDGTAIPGAAKPLKTEKNNYMAKFENGVIKGFYTEDGTLASDNQFAHITQTAGQSGVTKYKKPDTSLGDAGSIKVEIEGVTYEMPVEKLKDLDKDGVKYKRK